MLDGVKSLIFLFILAISSSCAANSPAAGRVVEFMGCSWGVPSGFTGDKTSTGYEFKKNASSSNYSSMIFSEFPFDRNDTEGSDDYIVDQAPQFHGNYSVYYYKAQITEAQEGVSISYPIVVITGHGHQIYLGNLSEEEVQLVVNSCAEFK